MCLIFWTNNTISICDKLINIYINLNSTNSKQHKLCVNRSHNIDTQLLHKATVCGDCHPKADYKIYYCPVNHDIPYQSYWKIEVCFYYHVQVPPPCSFLICISGDSEDSSSMFFIWIVSYRRKGAKAFQLHKFLIFI